MEVIAYYLPQFYPFKENNEWWGEGFTEWTNVGKAKPLFRNHYQPKVPADLGYYDLRMSETKEKQVELAKEAGVTAFCYWHYWFGNGKRLLDMPLEQVVNSGKPDFSYCLGWANESWKSKVWNSSSSKRDKLLIEQLYPGDEDIYFHFDAILSTIEDKRYLRIENKPVFVIYKPLLIPDVARFISIWNDLIRKSGIAEGFFFIGHTIDSSMCSELLRLGFNSVNIVRLGEYRYNKKVIWKIPFKLFCFKFLNRPLKLNYSFISRYFSQDIDRSEFVIPTLIPNWDHTPRSGKHGVVFHNSTPESFEIHALEVLKSIRDKKISRQIVFLKSWNEWGEGNYMEPDLKYGKKYIWALQNALRASSTDILDE